IVEHPDHCLFLKSKNGALGHRGRRRHAKRLSRQASFTKEISASQDRDNRFLPATGEDRQLHLALLNVKDRVGGTALREDGSFLSVILGGSPAGLRKVRPEVEWRVFLLCHEPAPHSKRGFQREFPRGPLAGHVAMDALWYTPFQFESSSATQVKSTRGAVGQSQLERHYQGLTANRAQGSDSGQIRFAPPRGPSRRRAAPGQGVCRFFELRR